MAELTNHLWQSTLFALAAGLLTLALRRNRAQIRFWLWLAASLKFLVPFALLMSLGGRLDVAPSVRSIAPPAVTLTVEQISEPFTGALPLTAAPRATTDWKPAALFAVWFCGFAGFACFRFRGWRRVRAAVRAGVPVDLPLPVEVRTAPGLLEPGVVGVRRPVLLLPDGIAERLTRAQWEAILAHELCHVRRRDNLFAALHMAVETLFWFHPLVWFVGARMVEERERACDEEVVRLGSEPQVYAEGILNVCKLYVASPLVCVSGVTGADLRKRIEAIMANRGALRLNFARKAALACAAMAALAAPVIVGLIHTTPGRAQSKQKFEVASVKLTKDCGAGFAGGRKDAKTKGGGPGAPPGPDRVHTCGTLESLIFTAYVAYENDSLNISGGRLNRPPMTGGPDWIHSDLYVIDAKAEGAPGQGVMNGSMMRALLEERFHLKIRREAHEVDVYDLSVGRNGPKLHPFEPGTCVQRDPNKQAPPPVEGGKPCMFVFLQGKTANAKVMEVKGTTVADFGKLVAVALGKPVIDKTGIAGFFDYHVEFIADDTTPFFMPGGGPGPPPDAESLPKEDAPGPSLPEAMQAQFGLKLTPSRGPRDFLVIDSVQRPAAN